MGFFQRLFAFAALLLLATTAHATVQDIPNLLQVTQEGAGTMTLNSDMLGCEPGTKDGTWLCNGIGQSFLPGNAAFEWQLSNWFFELDSDPIVDQAFGFKNLAATALNFTITTIIPVVPIAPSSLMNGSMGGSITDASGEGAGGMATVSPTALFTGMIDGAPVAAAQLHPHTFSLNFTGGGQTISIPVVNFGQGVGPLVPGPAVAVNIGIQNRFRLSAGDSVAMTNFFEVVVPEPSSVLLAAGGLIALAIARRRA